MDTSEANTAATTASCPKCRSKMVLVTIRPHPVSDRMERRTYLCVECNQTRTYALPTNYPPPFGGGLAKETPMDSLIIKRSIVIDGHKTSVSLEDPFWRELKDIAQGQHMTLSNMVGGIDKRRQHGNLSSAIRLFVLDRIATKVSGFSGERINSDMTSEGSATNLR